MQANINGREFAEKVSQMYPDIRVTYISVYTDNAIVHHGVVDAGMDFPRKPVMIRDLAETVRKGREGDVM